MEGSIDLGQPLPESVELPMGGFIFRIPAGAIALKVYYDGALVDSETGEWVGTPLPHPEQWEITRGRSRVNIDDNTGEIVYWDVFPEDEKDFQTLTEPEPIASSPE
ncbi:MAG: hypothetical protein WD472_07110 [Dehalococcoidia bacterium]